MNTKSTTSRVGIAAAIAGIALAATACGTEQAAEPDRAGQPPAKTSLPAQSRISPGRRRAGGRRGPGRARRRAALGAGPPDGRAPDRRPARRSDRAAEAERAARAERADALRWATATERWTALRKGPVHAGPCRASGVGLAHGSGSADVSRDRHGSARWTAPAVGPTPRFALIKRRPLVGLDAAMPGRPRRHRMRYGSTPTPPIGRGQPPAKTLAAAAASLRSPAPSRGPPWSGPSTPTQRSAQGHGATQCRREGPRRRLIGCRACSASGGRSERRSRPRAVPCRALTASPGSDVRRDICRSARPVKISCRAYRHRRRNVQLRCAGRSRLVPATSRARGPTPTLGRIVSHRLGGPYGQKNPACLARRRPGRDRARRVRAALRRRGLGRLRRRATPRPRRPPRTSAAWTPWSRRPRRRASSTSSRCRRTGPTTATIIKAFADKYGIKVNSAQPDAASQDEINAANQHKGNERAPDVFDLGQSVALANTAMFAPYKVATFDDIPDGVQGPRRHLGQRLRRLHVDRLRLGQGAGRRPTSTTCSSPSTRARSRSTATRPQAGAAFSGVLMAALSPRRLGRRHRARRRLLPASSRRPATSCRSTRPRRPSSPARPRSSSTGTT